MVLEVRDDRNLDDTTQWKILSKTIRDIRASQKTSKNEEVSGAVAKFGVSGFFSHGQAGTYSGSHYTG